MKIQAKKIADGVAKVWSKVPNPVQIIIICTALQAAGVPIEACQAIASFI